MQPLRKERTTVEHVFLKDLLSGMMLKRIATPLLTLVYTVVLHVSCRSNIGYI